MAHLIKLEDYISRYQFDIYRYPNQFTRLKRERWEALKAEWEHNKRLEANSTFSVDIDDDTLLKDAEEKSFFSKTLDIIKKFPYLHSNKSDTELSDMHPERFTPALRAKTLNELKNLFLDEIYLSQLRWASSSLLEKSYLNPKYRYDKKLKFFVTQIPDNYLLMYRPLFFIKQARIEMEVILISPTEVYCITMLEGTERSIYNPVEDRVWIETIDSDEHKIISPTIGLNRMASIVSEVLKEKDVKVPMKKVVLSPSSYIDYQSKGGMIEYVDRRNFDQWKEKVRKHPSPIKSQQLKVAKALLDQCHTTAFKRQEIIEQDDEDELD